MIDRRLAQHIDVLLLVLVATIVSMGVTTVYSATYAQSQSQMSPLVWRQAVWAMGGAGLMFALLLLDYRKLERYAYVIYAAALGLLVLVPLAGYLSGGSRRWIHLGFFALQPSELAKIALILALARFFHRDNARESYGAKEIVVPVTLCAVPALLTLAQPDLGSAAVMGFVLVSVVLVAGLRLRVMATLAVVAVLGIFVAGQKLWTHLKPYQQKRILTFLNPEADPLGAGYHLIQSKIAVGSGMFWGRGSCTARRTSCSSCPSSTRISSSRCSPRSGVSSAARRWQSSTRRSSCVVCKSSRGRRTASGRSWPSVWSR